MKLFFLKNKREIKINPATDETLSAIAAQTSLLTFDAQPTPSNLNIHVAAIAPGADVGIQNASNVTINPATQETLALVEGAIGQFTFDGKSGLKTSGAAPTLADTINVKDTTTANINPATDEATELWRRMVKLYESKQTMDANRIKRVTADAFGGDIVTGVGGSGVGASGSSIPLVTIANDFSENLVGLFTSTSYVGWSDQMYQDVARDAYARGIRNNLNFS